MTVHSIEGNQPQLLRTRRLPYNSVDVLRHARFESRARKMLKPESHYPDRKQKTLKEDKKNIM